MFPAQAIEYATEHGAQIISMSWATKTPERQVDKDAFDEAIREAHKKNILKFCSAVDQGQFKDFKYPHASNPNSTFKIGAATALGTIPDFVNDEDLSFLFPGHEVILSSPYEDVSDKRFDGFVSHTGSSVATALAAGLADLVLECVRLGHINSSNMQNRAIQRGDMGQDTEARRARGRISFYVRGSPCGKQVY